jgi:hypothetical protein
MISGKLSCIISGDPNYADNWHDVQGYARLAELKLLPTASNSRAILSIDAFSVGSTFPNSSVYSAHFPVQ